MNQKNPRIMPLQQQNQPYVCELPKDENSHNEIKEEQVIF